MPVPGCEPPRTLLERLSGKLFELGVFEMLRHTQHIDFHHSRACMAPTMEDRARDTPTEPARARELPPKHTCIRHVLTKMFKS